MCNGGKEEFTWSSTTYNLKQFIHKFEPNLPVLVCVKHGYCGVIEPLDFPAGQILMITEVRKEKRVIVNDMNKRALSVPLGHPLRFHVINEYTDDTYYNVIEPLKDILEKYNYGEEDNLLLETTEKMTICKDGYQRDTLQLGRLQVITVYDDTFLVTVPVSDDGHVFENHVSIPVFVDIVLAQANGCKCSLTGKQHSEEQFQKVLINLRRETLVLKNEDFLGNPEIMLYEGNLKRTAEYEYIEPMYYVTCHDREKLDKPSIYEHGPPSSCEPIQWPIAPIRPRRSNKARAHSKRAQFHPSRIIPLPVRDRQVSTPKLSKPPVPVPRHHITAVPSTKANKVKHMYHIEADPHYSPNPPPPVNKSHASLASRVLALVHVFSENSEKRGSKPRTNRIKEREIAGKAAL